MIVVRTLAYEPRIEAFIPDEGILIATSVDAPIDLSRAAWRMSARSSGACVEVAHLAQAVAIRDSKDPARPEADLYPAELAAVHQDDPARQLRAVAAYVQEEPGSRAPLPTTYASHWPSVGGVRCGF
jgi:hypothetical protein